MSMPADEPQSPWVDPIVAEVRAARERIVAAVGGALPVSSRGQRTWSPAHAPAHALIADTCASNTQAGRGGLVKQPLRPDSDPQLVNNPG